MASLRLSPIPSLGVASKLHSDTQLTKLLPFLNTSFSFSSHQRYVTKFKLFTSTTPFASAETEIDTKTETRDEKFDWYAQWYPVMPVCDLDKRVPLGKKVIGIDVVVWWDRNEDSWKVFDDSCPHRLAPLSEGRIDQWGRLQCVYHGWCFNGGGDCKLIPQAPPDGPPVHTFKKACATVYPSTVQNGIVWFWPNSDPQCRDILTKKKPPYIPEIDDPSYSTSFGNRDIPYGYEILVDNLLDPAHVPYSHYGILQAEKPASPVDREGGMPLDMAVNSLDASGFDGKWDTGSCRFFAPCVSYTSLPIERNQDNNTKSEVEKKSVLVFICIPVSPGKSRLIWAFPRNFAIWVDKVIPRWMFHVGQNLLVIDSDACLLHVEEHKIMEAGGSKEWQKSCFVPTKSDALIVGFRKWLNKYGGGRIDWRGRFNGDLLPPTPPREVLLDRYWTHVVNCSSCSVAYKGLNLLKLVLQLISISLIGIIAATKQATPSMMVSTRTAMVSTAILCFVASKVLGHFVHKYFHFHDYNHAFH